MCLNCYMLDRGVQHKISAGKQRGHTYMLQANKRARTWGEGDDGGGAWNRHVAEHQRKLGGASVPNTHTGASGSALEETLWHATQLSIMSQPSSLSPLLAVPYPPSPGPPEKDEEIYVSSKCCFKTPCTRTRVHYMYSIVVPRASSCCG